MTYQVTVQPEAFQEIEQSYRWLCDNQTPDLGNDWYNDLQETIDSLKPFLGAVRSHLKQVSSIGKFGN